MNKTMNWILGILIALLIIGVVVVVVWWALGYFGMPMWTMGAPDWRPGDGWRELPRDPSPWRGMPMHPYNRLPGARLLPFFPFGGFFAGLLCLGVIALIIFGFIALVASLIRPKKAAESASATTAPVSMEAAPQSSARVCPSCARPVQPDWRLCPYCGSELG